MKAKMAIAENRERTELDLFVWMHFKSSRLDVVDRIGEIN